MRVLRHDRASLRLDGIGRLSDGTLRCPAYLTRTGVFAYQKKDGTLFYELRRPEEVFQPDSMMTLAGLAVTVGHPGMVTPENWKANAVGHVADNVRREDIYIAADVIIKDAATIEKVRYGELSELSCGYEVDLDMQEGEYEGAYYNAIQRTPRYNHVAMGGRYWGRAGPDVRIIDR